MKDRLERVVSSAPRVAKDVLSPGRVFFPSFLRSDCAPRLTAALG